MKTKFELLFRKTHQAAEFSAYVTLNTAKYASGALISTLTSRRLLWLCQWQADLRAKWRLAATPFMGGMLFGESLDPLLIDNREKRKILLSSARWTDG